jgi:cyclopropane fatty-acyl-phospholipid synthase-like methyltransferase
LRTASFPSMRTRSLPFAREFFDAVVSIDSFFYYGTDEQYLNYISRFLKPDGPLGIAGAGLMREIESSVPDHLREWWTPDLWGLHSADWWRRHWDRTRILNVELTDTLAGGWQYWRDWLQLIAPENLTELKALETDSGRYLGYVRAVGRRRAETQLMEPIVSVPSQYSKHPLLRGQAKGDPGSG